MKKKLKSFFTLLFLIFIVLCPNRIQAKEISVDDVISFMESNNILDDSELFYMFGKMLNGEDEYDISSFKFNIEKESETINVKSTLTDAKKGDIEITTILSYQDNFITYTNNNELDSLGSRVDTLIFSQLIYSIGGARGYSKDSLVDWMNQINLSTVTEEEGISCEFAKVNYYTSQEGRIYQYELSVPITYTIDITQLTEDIPNNYDVEIKNIEVGISSISMTIYSETNRSENCNIYRKNIDTNKYELVGTVSCSNGEFMDTDLKEDTTYYYQVAVEDKIMCSKETPITTDKSPITGAFIHVGGLIILVIIGIALYFINKKYELLKKI